MEADIMHTSRSSWSFLVVIVDTKDGFKWFCIDSRKLNQITKKIPPPLMGDILALVRIANYFTSLDVKSGYWQVTMDVHDKEKTEFTTFKCLQEFSIMPFGLSNYPVVFQEIMSVVLQLVTVTWHRICQQDCQRNISSSKLCHVLTSTSH